MTPSVAACADKLTENIKTVSTHPELPVRCRALHAPAIAIAGASTFTTCVAKQIRHLGGPIKLATSTP
jgi:hypothetical protein